MVNARYEVCWPWREENPDLPGNCNLAYGLLNYLDKLTENPEMLKMYDNMIKDRLNKRVIKSVGDNSTP